MIAGSPSGKAFDGALSEEPESRSHPVDKVNCKQATSAGQCRRSGSGVE